MGLLKRCGGSNLCRITKIIHNACYSVLAHNGFIAHTPSDIFPNKRPSIVTSSKTAKTSLGSFKSVSSNADAHCSGDRFGELFSVALPKSVQENLNALSSNIMQLIEQNEAEELRNLSRYCFLEGGKMIRPTVVLLMAGCCSSLSHQNEMPISISQNKVAVVSEMIHTASLVHDDVIDESNERRNRPTVSAMAGNKSAILVGDYILAKATQLLTTIGDADVIALLAQVIEDLVKGEFMQLGSRASEDERFMHYMMKTFKKTASLFAHSCKAVAKLAGCDEYGASMAYEFGKNLGIAFQLIDDTLDFVVRSSEVGKPTFVDLKLGIATAPVLFASRQHSQLNDLILRRFAKDGDVELAYNLILNSDGLLRSRQLAEQYCKNAIDNLAQFPDSEFKKALAAITSAQCSRNR